MKPNTLFQVRFRPSVTPPRGWTHSAIYNVLNYDRHHDKYLIGKTWLPAKYFIKIEVQDAPVFDKPVLRKIASLKENECIEIPNDTILDLILEQAEIEGLKWRNVMKLKDIDVNPPYCIAFNYLGTSFGLTYADLEFHKSKNDTILPASKFVEVPQEKEPETDWSKVPFPDDYVVPKGIEVVVISESRNEDNPKHRKIGLKGITTQTHIVPDCDWEDGMENIDMVNSELAPINATDHPNHPEFGKKQEGVLSNLPTAVDLLKHHFDTQFEKQEEPITETQKDECKTADERIKELENETITQGEQANVATGSVEELDKIFKNPYMDERQRMHQQTLSENNKLYSQLETIKRLAKIAIQHEDYEHMRVILKSIATGEI
jgi:hypothetical protein